MKLGFSMLTQSYPDAAALDYGDCALFQVVCPICFEAIFKCVRRAGAAGGGENIAAVSESEGERAYRHYLSHYNKAPDTASCELRVQAMAPRAVVEKNQIARQQNLCYFVSVLKNAALQSFSKIIADGTIMFYGQRPLCRLSEISSFLARKSSINRVRVERFDQKIKESERRLIYLETTNDSKRSIRAACAAADWSSAASLYLPAHCRNRIMTLKCYEVIFSLIIADDEREMSESEVSVSEMMRHINNDIRNRYFNARKMMSVKLLAGICADRFKEAVADHTLGTGPGNSDRPWHEWVKEVIETIESNPGAPAPLPVPIPDQSLPLKFTRSGEDDFYPQADPNFEEDARGVFQPAHSTAVKTKMFIEQFNSGRFVLPPYGIMDCVKSLQSERLIGMGATMIDKLLGMDGDEYLLGPEPQTAAEMNWRGQRRQPASMAQSFAFQSAADILAHLIDTSTGRENKEQIFIQALLLADTELTFLHSTFDNVNADGGDLEKEVAAQNGMTVVRNPSGILTAFEASVGNHLLKHLNAFANPLTQNQMQNFIAEMEQLAPPEEWLDEEAPDFCPPIGERHHFAGRTARNGLEVYLFAVWRNVFRIVRGIDYPGLLAEQKSPVQAAIAKTVSQQSAGSSSSGSPAVRQQQQQPVSRREMKKLRLEEKRNKKRQISQ